MPYPVPIDTTAITLSDDLNELSELLAENTHNVWASARIKEGWSFGSERNDTEKKTPCLVPYKELPANEKAYDKQTAIETLKVIKMLGYKISK